MAKKEKTLRICSQGHRYYKSTECSTCPKCAQLNKPTEGLFARLSSPARNALLQQDITTVQQLAKYTEKEILSFHGIGPSTLPLLKRALEEENLCFCNTMGNFKFINRL